MSAHDAETDPRYHGWLVVAVCFLVLAVANGARFSFGVILDPLVETFDASRGAVSFTSSVQLVAYAVSQPVMGELIDRYGGVRVFWASICISAAGLVGSAFATSLFGLYLTLGVLLGFGFGGVGALAIAALLSRWFTRRRGFAVSVANSGFNVGQLAIVPLVGLALSTLNWEASMAILGVAVLGTLVPAYLVFRSDAARERTDGSEGTAATAGQLDVSTLREAVRTRSFGGIVVGYLFCGFTDFMILVHLVSYLQGVGFSLAFASAALGLLGASSFVGVIASGWISDRMKTKDALAALYASRIVALVLLAQVAALGSLDLVGVYVFIALFGFSLYATAPLTSTLASDLYGDSLMGSVFGWAAGIHHVGGALGAGFAGVVFDLTGGYAPAFYVGAVGVLLGAFASYLVRERRVARDTVASS